MRDCEPTLFRSELIQLVTVTQKRAESLYRELIEQQINSYKSRYVWFFDASHHAADL